MKIFVFSDSHGNTQPMLNVLQQKRDECDFIIHLGDHCTDINCIGSIVGITPVIAVSGNNDFFSDLHEFPYDTTVEIAGKRLFICHGHKLAVKRNLSLLITAAKNKNCSIALFGHTHIPYVKTSDNISLFNPGSIGVFSGKKLSYGTITINNNNVKFEINEV